MFKKLFNKIVYATTKKPDHYVHVDKPKTLQECRQVQYNKWCKRKGVYNGSYMPEDPETLLKKGKGWEYATTHEKNKQGNKQYQRKSSKQIVRFDEGKINKKGQFEEKHYHWQVGKSVVEQRAFKDINSYYDRYGNLCNKKSLQYHLAPKDREYNYNKLKGGK